MVEEEEENKAEWNCINFSFDELSTALSTKTIEIDSGSEAKALLTSDLRRLQSRSSEHAPLSTARCSISP